MNHTFNFNTLVTNFLFLNWNAEELPDFIGLCCFSGVLVIILEAVKAGIAYVHKQLHANPITYAMTEQNMAGRSPLLRSLVIPSSVQSIKYRKIKLHISETLVHMLHLVVGYFVMLIVMRLNVYIIIAIVIGSALGFFIFGAIRHVYFESHPMEPRTETFQEPSVPQTESTEPLFDSRELDASMQSISEGTRARVQVHRQS